MTTAAGSRCDRSETRETGVRVLSLVLDFCETAVVAETEGHQQQSSTLVRNRRVQSRISKNGASNGTDETGTSRRTDRDAETTGRFDPAASPGHGRSNNSPNSRTGVSRHGKNCSKACSTSRRRRHHGQQSTWPTLQIHMQERQVATMCESSWELDLDTKFLKP